MQYFKKQISLLNKKGTDTSQAIIYNFPTVTALLNFVKITVTLLQ